MKKIFSILTILVSITIYSCNTSTSSHEHSHDVIGEQDDHSHSSEVVSITKFTDTYELFVEFPPLITAQKSDFTVHITTLDNHEPVSEGKLTVSIVKGGKGIRHTVETLSSPGIFTPALLPKEPGIYRMTFRYQNSSETILFDIPEIEVFSDMESAANSIGEDSGGDDIIFLKEQAWKGEFETGIVKKQSFHSVLKTSARVKNHPQSELTINAPSAGMLTWLSFWENQ